MNFPHLLSHPEVLYLKRFFDAVDFAVTAEVNTARVAYEEFLSPVLGRLLDDSSPFQSLLSYSSRQLNSDLAECGSGNHIDVRFETNEHAKGFSGKTSHADLGIVFRRENPILGPAIEKAILVESKRLYLGKNSYTVRSRYDGFDEKQYKELKNFAKNYGWESIYYFLYNPSLEAFEEGSRQVIRAWENSHTVGNVWRGDVNEFFYMVSRGLPFPYVGEPTLSGDADDAKKLLNRITQSRPGLKVIGLQGVQSIVEKDNRIVPTSFGLSACYEYARSDKWIGSSLHVPFVSLASFVVDFFMSCIRGSIKAEVISMAKGRDPTMKPRGGPPAGGGGTENAAADNLPTTLLARHTLTITLRSELPEVEGMLPH